MSVFVDLLGVIAAGLALGYVVTAYLFYRTLVRGAALAPDDVTVAPRLELVPGGASESIAKAA